MMLAPVLRAALPIALAGTLGVQSAQADIYTWIDASGAMNVSNIAPPDGAKVIKVTHEAPPPSPSEAQALADRVKQLEAQLAQRPVPPPADYVPLQYAPPPVQYTQPAPTVVQYFVQSAPQQPQYAAQPQYYAPEYDSTDYWAGNYTGNWAGNNWCDPNWLNCGWGPYGWAPGFYPPSVVVVNTSNPKRNRPGNGFNPGHRPTRPPIVSPFTTNPVAPLTSAPQMGMSLNTSMNARRPPASLHRG